METSEGVWLIEHQDGTQQTIDVYEHPIKGLCVWFRDYEPGGSLDVPTSTDGDGHIPINCSPLKFLYKTGVF